MKRFNKDSLRAGDWFKILSLAPEDTKSEEASAYVGKVFEYMFDNYARPVDNPMSNAIPFYVGFLYTTENLHT
jgi:hypothetical protein